MLHGLLSRSNRPAMQNGQYCNDQCPKTLALEWCFPERSVPGSPYPMPVLGLKLPPAVAPAVPDRIWAGTMFRFRKAGSAFHSTDRKIADDRAAIPGAVSLSRGGGCHLHRQSLSPMSRRATTAGRVSAVAPESPDRCDLRLHSQPFPSMDPNEDASLPDLFRR